MSATYSNNNLAIIILAAGKGKRMLNPNLPKVLSKINDKPLIAYVVDTAISLNPYRIVVVVGFHKDLVIDFLKSYSTARLDFVEQKEQLGTGHAVAQAEGMLRNFDGDVMILCGDVPFLELRTLRNFLGHHRNENADISVLTTYADEPKGYGRIIRNKQGELARIVEEKDATEEQKQVKEINSGVFLVKSKLLFPALKMLSNANSQGEYYLTDIVEILLSSGNKATAFPGADFQELQGINSPSELEQAERYLNTKNNNYL